VSVSELSDEELSRISGGVSRIIMSCFCELDHYSYAVE
jgi:bacteriocin-like protein